MHHAKGLIQSGSVKTLRLIEAAAKPLEKSGHIVLASLMDIYGRKDVFKILHVDGILRSLQDVTTSQGLTQLRTLKRELSTPSCVGLMPDELTALPPLYVKGALPAMQKMLTQRQEHFVAKLEGRLLAQNATELNKFIKKLLEKTTCANQPFTGDEIATFRGIVEALGRSNPEAALALGVNSKLPLLNAAVAVSLVQLVDLNSQPAIDAFLEGFAPRDDILPAYETCATRLAICLRQKFEEAETKDAAAATRAMLTSCHRFNIDPGEVYPQDATAIQAWAALQGADAENLPCQRAALLQEIIARRLLLPRRISINALSAWCLADLGPCWVQHALTGTCLLTPSNLKPSAAPSSFKEDPVRAASYRTALNFILKDSKRNLVNNRLLHQYAQLLCEGEIAVTDESFPAFLEECGECHSSADCPSAVEFALHTSAVERGSMVVDALRNLAPRCSYWTTLLRCAPERVQVFIAPGDNLRVQVTLPRTHECTAAAASLQSRDLLPSIPVLYEDDDVMVVDKPAGLASSRHALSCSQLGQGATVVDLVSIMLQGSVGRAFGKTPRQGQVHRLDTETSGCLLLAKTAAAANSLIHQMGTSAAYSQHSKVYLALCVAVEPQLVRLPLKGELRDQADPKVRTRYRILKFLPSPRLALVECRLQQGKKHQLRRHLASAGLPIIGDLVHGGALCSRSIISRVALHARSIRFVHPIKAEPMCVVAPLPEDFRRALQVFK